MAERVSRIKISFGDDHTDTRRILSMRGFVPFTAQVENDAIITSVTGLESPEMAIAGGEVAYGGSVFTNAIPNDREFVITIRPKDLDLNSIKQKLNSLIGLSSRQELTLTVETVTNQGVTSSLTTTGYITSFNAPIFAKDTALTITFRSPKPYLQRPRMNATSSHNFRRFYNQQGSLPRWGYYIEPLPLADDSAMSAPSPFLVRLSFKNNIHKLVTNFSVVDPNRNVATLSMDTYMADKTFSSTPGVVADTLTRRMGSYDDGMITLSEFVLSLGLAWPVVYPSDTRTEVNVSFLGDPSSYSPSDIVLEEFFVYPRVYGI